MDDALTDRTSAWMARDDARRLRAGGSVTLRDGEGGYTFHLDGCGVRYPAASMGSVAACR